TLQARVAGNALELARNGVPREPFYLTGQVGGRPFSLHAEGERVFLTGPAGGRREIDLAPPAAPASGPGAGLPEPGCPQGLVGDNPWDYAFPVPPGESPLDEGLRQAEEAPPPAEGGAP